jgi:hypothetical protein
MLKTVLVKELIDEGARVLHELDRRGYPVQGAFWLYLPESEYWRLVLASPLVDQQGPIPAYRDLREALRATKPSTLTLEDISVLSPDGQDYQALLGSAVGVGGLGFEAARGRVSPVVFQDAYIYRLPKAA